MTTTHDTSPRRIAYFSMEVGIGAQIPTHSGGLGVLAATRFELPPTLRCQWSQ